MSDRLKFIKDVETRARGLSGDSVRRNFDALDELRTENARLRRELIDAREENRQLREQLAQQPSPSVAISPRAVATHVTSKAPSEPETEKDGTEIRFSLLEFQ